MRFYEWQRRRSTKPNLTEYIILKPDIYSPPTLRQSKSKHTYIHSPYIHTYIQDKSKTSSHQSPDAAVSLASPLHQRSSSRMPTLQPRDVQTTWYTHLCLGERVYWPWARATPSRYVAACMTSRRPTLQLQDALETIISVTLYTRFWLYHQAFDILLWAGKTQSPDRFCMV